MDFGSLADIAATGPDDVGTSAAASSVPTDGVREAGEFGGGDVVTVRDDGDGDETETRWSRDGDGAGDDGDESRWSRDGDATKTRWRRVATETRQR